MANYIILAGFTDQGIRNVRETTARADAFREMAKKFGVTTRDIYWTLGQYDVVALVDSPDEASITTLALALGTAGNVRTQVMRAFTQSEMKGILAKLSQKTTTAKKVAVPA
jgi:uncharacterized protein with GYD domain